MDMKFIQNVKKDSKEFRMVELILDIAAFLKVPVVAEGVETEEQIQMLRRAGCELVQGFYFSPPVPAGEFEKIILDEMEKNR
jgi:EAL domain-containing protein (putative c-di-GMP-specific phosphodiesterase class I)